MSNTPFPLHRVLEAECTCFPGTCRGGQVVAGKLACGQRCKEQIPARPEKVLDDEEIGNIFWNMHASTSQRSYLHFARKVEAAVLRKLGRAKS